MAINRSLTFPCVPHDDCDIVNISMTPKKTQSARNALCEKIAFMEYLCDIDYVTGFYAEACWPLNGPLFSPLNPLNSIVGGRGDRTAAKY